MLSHLGRRFPDADLFTLIHERGSVPPSIESRKIHTSALDRVPGRARHYRKLLPLFPWAIERFDFSGYDLVLSTSHAVAKSVRVPRGVPHVDYCFTPMRYVWDRIDAYLGEGARRTLARPLVERLRDFDVRTSGPDRVTRFLAISTDVADRIARHYGRTARVIAPPVDVSWIDAYLGEGARRTLARPLVERLRDFDVRTSGPDRVTRFLAISTDVADRIARHYGRTARVIAPPVDVSWIDPASAPGGDFYLLVGGFVPYKREDLVIEAFRRNRRPLVVAGDGPGRAELARNAPSNVRFVGRVPDDELARLYRSARALVYPQHEDFGLVAVEAQAAGCPVIGFGRGGLLDTVVPLVIESDGSRETAPVEATGVFFDAQTPESLCEAVERFERHEHRFNPCDLRRWAEGFSPARFDREFDAEIALAFGEARKCPTPSSSQAFGRPA